MKLLLDQNLSHRLVEALLTRGFNAVYAIHEGLWLGLLDRAASNEPTQFVFARRAAATTASATNERPFPLGEVAVERHFAGFRRILVTCGGAGREAIALAKLGSRSRRSTARPSSPSDCSQRRRRSRVLYPASRARSW